LKLDFNNDKSIYLQIAESIEDDILKNAMEEESQIPSTNQIALIFSINPATAGKGINILVDEGILYKKRGIGMFVKEGAREIIMQKRKGSFFDHYIVSLIEEAKKIGISKEELVSMITEGGNNHE